MRLRVFPALAPMLLAACAPAAAPPAAPAPAGVPPVLALLDARERLALSGDQVVALESIARDWEAANDTLARRIGALQGRGASPLRLAVGRHARTARAAIAENNRRAALAVERALQPDQRQMLCTAHRLKHRTGLAVRAAKTTARGSSHQAVHAKRRADSSPPWPWCAAPPSQSVEARTAS